MADDKIIIQIQLDDGTVKQGFIDIKKQAKDAGDGINKSFGGLSGFAKAGAALAGIALAVKAVGKAFDFLGDAISEASQSADAINKFNSALVASGNFSKQASIEFQNYADSLQKVTQFSDEAVLETGALISQIGRLSGESLKEATKAALDLSTALGIDVNTAATLLGKAANGNIETFKRYGIEIRKGATDAETLANALKTLQDRFGGASERAATTFSGSLSILRNQYSGLLETIGGYITQSPALIAVFGVIGKFIGQITQGLKDSFGNQDLLKGFISNIINLAGILTSALLPPLELIFNISKSIILSLGTGIGILAQGFVEFFNILAEGAKLLGFDGPLVQGIDAITEKTRELTSFLANETLDSFGALGDASISEGAINALAEFKGAVDLTNGSLKETTDQVDKLNNLPSELATSTMENIPIITSLFENLGITIGKVVETSAEELKRMGDVGKSVGSQIQQGLGQVASKGIQTLTTALIKGGNAFKDFGKFILSALGDLAIQVGTTLLTAGIGMLALKALDPTGAIIAGAALIALGSIMKAIGGGGDSGVETAPGGAGAGGVGAIAGGGESPTQDLNQLDEQRAGNLINVNVQGDIMDSTDTGLRIVDLIKQYGDLNGNDTVTA